MGIVTPSLLEQSAGLNGSPAKSPSATADVPYKDGQLADAEHNVVGRRIDGVVVRAATTIQDERGSLCEMYRPSWDVHDAPLVYVYHVTIRPGATKGWVVHRKQDDRIFVSGAGGVIQAVLYDDRADSPTYGLINELTFGDANRALFTIPAGVWHALRNVGTSDATFINMPTRPYDYEDPDKHRLPLDTGLIPYTWR